MDPQLQGLALQLAEAAVRNTAGSVADRITAAKARRKDQETIAELEDILNGLLSDKSELVRIAQAYEEELVAQRISATDVEYITEKFVPILKTLAEAADGGGDDSSVEEMLDLLEPLLSVETVTILQLLGFNFRRAIGEPLTELVVRLIQSKTPPSPEFALVLQELSQRRELAYLDVARDAEAFARLTSLTGRGGTP